MNYPRDGYGHKSEVRRGIINIIFCFAALNGSAQKSVDYFDRFITDTLLSSAHLGVSVFDPAANTFIHSYQSNKYFVPASNIKIVTCYSALKYLPDSLSIDVRDTWWKDLGAGWAWTDDEEIENVFPIVPFLDSGAIWTGKIDSLLRPMMYRSNNFLAEQLLRTISRKKLDKNGTEPILDSLQTNIFNGHLQKPVWADGSGLSRYNLFTPQHFIFILNKIYAEYGITRIKTIFPTGGSGTLKNYYLLDKGFIYAKTGSLTGVVTFSGYLYTRQNKLLIFSVLINNHHSSATAIRRRIETFIRQLRHNN